MVVCYTVLCAYSLMPSCVGTAIDYQPRSARKKGVPEPGTVPEIWRYSETKPIAEMLASWKQKFRTLEWTVDPFKEEGGMMLRYDRATDVCPSVAFKFAMPSADPSVTWCRKSVRSTVIMAGLMTFGAMNVVRSCESGTGLLMSGQHNLVIACMRLLVSLRVRMTYRTMLDSSQAWRRMVMTRLRYKDITFMSQQ